MKAILQSLKVLAFRVTKKILNPKSVTSYGQGGEDLILERLFEGKAKTLSTEMLAPMTRFREAIHTYFTSGDGVALQSMATKN